MRLEGVEPCGTDSGRVYSQFPAVPEGPKRSLDGLWTELLRPLRRGQRLGKPLGGLAGALTGFPPRLGRPFSVPSGGNSDPSSTTSGRTRLGPTPDVSKATYGESHLIKLTAGTGRPNTFTMSRDAEGPLGAHGAGAPAGVLAFDARESEQIADLVARYPDPGAALLPVLHLAQDKFGHLAPPVQLLVAGVLAIPPARVREVVTFYEMYHEHPEGQFHLEVCTNISCHLLGGDGILDHLCQRLAIKPGETTEDGMFSLMEAECLASCGSGVCMKVGLDYYEQLTVRAVDTLLDQLKAKAPGLKGKQYRHAEPEPHVGPVEGFEPHG